MTKLCAAVALACALAAPGSVAAEDAGAAAAEDAGPAAAAGTGAPGARPAAKPVVERAEAAARRAVAPHAVENVVCIQRSRRRVLCLLRHPDAGGRQCRSAVLVRGSRVRVVQSNVCFEVREVTP